MKTIKKSICLILAIILALSLSVTAFAAGNATIDASRTASMNIYKYDITSAEKDGAWDASSYVSTGIYDSAVNEALGGATNYAIQGVKFTYLRIADIFMYSVIDGATNKTMVVYGMKAGDTTQRLLTALGLTYANAHHQIQDTYYFTSDSLITSLERSLANNATSTKNALEDYIAANGGVTLPETDQYGHTGASELPLGLYLVVETSVPENVTSTTSPFLVSLPMTTINGSEWNYEVTLYPKNNTGDPTLEKTVREASTDTGKNSGSTDDIGDGYAHTATGSDGDVMEYQILSTLPTITSEASYITTYTFVDTLTKGIAYNQNDVVIEFFRDAGCTERITTWTQSDGKFNVDYAGVEGGSSMTISMTSAGLSEINASPDVYGTSGIQRGYSNCTMRITYAATVHCDDSVVYGDGGNPNEVQLTWRRTNTEFFGTLKDDCHVFTYGIDLTKEFSDGAGNYANVKMIVRNDTDNYYLQATEQDGIYYVTGRAATEEDATVFIPASGKKIIIKGMEDDTYSITEVATDDGYVLLKETITVVISTSEGEICDVCHKPLLTAKGSVNGDSVDMITDGDSVHALVPLSVTNTKGFDLPQTGGHGLWIYATIGIIVMAGAATVIFFLTRRRLGHR